MVTLIQVIFGMPLQFNTVSHSPASYMALPTAVWNSSSSSLYPQPCPFGFFDLSQSSIILHLSPVSYLLTSRPGQQYLYETKYCCQHMTTDFMFHTTHLNHIVSSPQILTAMMNGATLQVNRTINYLKKNNKLESQIAQRYRRRFRINS